MDAEMAKAYFNFCFIRIFLDSSYIAYLLLHYSVMLVTLGLIDAERVDVSVSSPTSFVGSIRGKLICIHGCLISL